MVASILDIGVGPSWIFLQPIAATWQTACRNLQYKYIQHIHTAHRTSLYTLQNWDDVTSQKVDKLRIELAIWTVSRLVIHKKPCVWGQEIPSLSCRKSLTPGLPGPLIGPSCCLQKILAVWLYLSFLSCQTIQNWVEFNFGDSMTVTKLDPQSWRSLNHLKGSKVNAPSPKKATTSRCTQNRITCFFFSLRFIVYRITPRHGPQTNQGAAWRILRIHCWWWNPTDPPSVHVGPVVDLQNRIQRWVFSHIPWSTDPWAIPGISTYYMTWLDVLR